MDEFAKLVKDCRKKKSSRIIHNASIQHAHILFENLLESSKEDKAGIIMVSGKLTGTFYSPLAGKFKECLDNGSNVKIVVLDNADLSENALLATVVKEHANGSVTKKDLPSGDEFPHFILVGENRFRAEIDHEQSKAFASFNIPETGAILQKMFSDLTSPSRSN